MKDGYSEKGTADNDISEEAFAHARALTVDRLIKETGIAGTIDFTLRCCNRGIFGLFLPIRSCTLGLKTPYRP